LDLQRRAGTVEAILNPRSYISNGSGGRKNIVPAIASTNAIIAASTTSEALKIATSCNPYLENYMMYAGEEGVYAYTFNAKQKPDCPVCGNLARKIVVDPGASLKSFIESLGELAETQLKKPSLRTEEKRLYQRFPPQLEEQTRCNLRLKLRELISDGQEIAISDPTFAIDFRYSSFMSLHCCSGAVFRLINLFSRQDQMTLTVL
jgi:ubiquitin-activating enzyme E1 C